MLEEEREDCVAFIGQETNNVTGIGRVDEQTLGTGFGMDTNDGVSGAAILGDGIGVLLRCGSAKAIPKFRCATEIVKCSKAFEVQLHVR